MIRTTTDLKDALPLGPQDPETERSAAAIWAMRRLEVAAFSGLELPAWEHAEPAHKDMTRLMARAALEETRARAEAGARLFDAVVALRGRGAGTDVDDSWLDRAVAQAREIYKPDN